MNKKLIRLTESDLHRIVKESLKRALSETADHNMAVDDKKYFDSDESWKAKKYQDERDKFLTNPNYVGTPSLYDPMNYKEVEDFVDDEEDGTYKHWMDEIGYEGATNNDSIYNTKGNFFNLANKQREHLLNKQTKPWLHNESKKVNKKLVRLTEQDLHKIVKESVNRILKETSDDLLNRAIDASKDKMAKYKELYGKQSVPYHHACRQSKYFDDEYGRRYDSGNNARRAKLERGKIDLKNKREGTTAGERERANTNRGGNSNKSKGLRRFFKK